MKYKSHPHMIKVNVVQLSLLLLSFLVTACGGSSDNKASTPPTNTQTSFNLPTAITYTDNAIVITEGVLLTTQSPNLSGSNIDPASTFDFSASSNMPTSITINSSSGVITIGQQTASGSYDIGVAIASSAGTANFDNVLNITVNAAPPSTEFQLPTSLTYSNNSLFVEQGLSLTSQTPILGGNNIDPDSTFAFDAGLDLPEGFSIDLHNGVVSVKEQVPKGRYVISVSVNSTLGMVNFPNVLEVDVDNVKVVVSYIANEGVLLEDKITGNKVIVDGIFQRVYTQFDAPNSGLLQKLEAGDAPYDNTTVIIATHEHEDHFSAESVGKHLNKNENTQLLISSAIRNRMQSEFSEFDAVATQVLAVDAAQNELKTVNIAAMPIKNIGLSHVGNYGNIVSMGYIIEMSGKNIMHIGDASLTNNNFANLDLGGLEIDVLIVPYFDVLSTQGSNIINNIIRPKHLIISHLQLGMNTTAITNAYQNEMIFSSENDVIKVF